MSEAKHSAPLSGDIHYFRLPEILQLLALGRLTGKLSLAKSQDNVEIYFREGKVVFTAGEKRAGGEQLGSLMVRMGSLDEDRLNEALVISGQTGSMLGRTLVRRGFVTREEITTALRKQTERSVCKAMAWGEGSFRFEFCDLPEHVKDMPVEIKVDDFIFEDGRRIKKAQDTQSGRRTQYL